MLVRKLEGGKKRKKEKENNPKTRDLITTVSCILNENNIKSPSLYWTIAIYGILLQQRNYCNIVSNISMHAKYFRLHS